VSDVLAGYAAARLASVGRRAELEPKLALDVGASCAVRAPSTAVSAGLVVNDDGVDAAEVELSTPTVSPTPVHGSVADDAWLGRLASPSLGGRVADAEAHATDVVGPRSSTAPPAPAIPPALVPDAAVDDGQSSSSPAVVDATCASPAPVLPTPSPDEPRATGPALSVVAIVVATLDQATLDLGHELASSPAPPAPMAAPVAVDPTPSVDVPPASSMGSVEVSRPVPRLPAAWSARLVDGVESETEAAAVVAMSVAPPLPVDAPAALVGDVEGAAGA